MPKVLPRVLTALGILVALVILVPLVLYAIVPKERVRQIVVGELETKLQRPVRIRSADYSIFPRFRLRLDDVMVGSRPGSGEPQISASRVQIGMHLLPLLHREVVVTGIEIDHPYLQMVTKSATPASGAPAQSASPASQPVNLRVQDLRIRDGEADVRLPDGTPLLHVGGLSEHLKARLEQGAAVLTGTTGLDTLRVHTAAGDFGRGLQLTLQKKLRYDLPSGRLQIDQATLDVNGLPIAVTGNVAGLTTPTPVFDLNLRGGPGNLSDILGLVPARLFPERREFRSSGTLAMRGTVQGPAKDARFDIALSLDNGRIESSSLPAPVEGIRLRLRARPDSLDLRDFAASMGSSTLRAGATLADYRSTSPQVGVSAEADLDLSALNGLYTPRDSLEMAGRATARINAAGPAGNPQALRVDGNAAITGGAFRGAMLPAPLSDVNGRFTFSGQTMTLQGLSARMGSSDFAAAGTIDNFQALAPTAKVPGRARADLTLRSRLINLDEILPNQTKEGGGAPGPAHPSANLPPLDGTLAINADRVVSRGITATNVAGRIVLNQGMVTIEKLGGGMFGGDMALNGDVDLRNMQSPQFNIAANGQGLGIGDLLSQVPALNRFSRLAGFLNGRMQVKTGMKGALTDSLMLDPRTLTSDGNLEIDQARLTGYPLQAAVASFLNAPQIRDLPISDWKESFHIEQGRLNVQGLILNAGPVQVTANGWQAIDGTMHLSVDLLLPPELSAGVRSKLPPEAAAILEAPGTNRVFIPLLLNGNATSPQVGIDTQRLTQAAGRQAEARLQQEASRLQQQAIGQGQRMLQGILGKQAPAPADTTGKGASASKADSAKNVLRREAEKRLGRLLGR